MEEFLPGLFKVMEERLGPLGRPITTLLVLAIVAGIFVWVGDLVYSKAILPLTTVVGEPSPYIKSIVKELNRLLEHAGLDKRVRIPGTVRQPSADRSDAQC